MAAVHLNLLFAFIVIVTACHGDITPELDKVFGIYTERNSSFSIQGSGNIQDFANVNLIIDQLHHVDLYDLMKQFGHDNNALVKGIGEHCFSDTLFLLKNIQLQTALSFIDAMGKPPSGILKGSTFWAGDMQECSDIPGIKNAGTNETFNGKYMVVSIFTNERAISALGVCVPSSCNETDTPQLMNLGILALKTYVPQLKNVSIAVTQPAYGVESEPLDAGAKTYLVIVGILASVVMISTVVDYCCTKWKTRTEISDLDGSEKYTDLHEGDDRTGLITGELSSTVSDIRINSAKHSFLKFVKVFSIFSNGKKLFGTETASGPLACLNGIRVVSMWWVIQGHVYAFVVYFSDNTADVADIVKRFSFQPILNGTYSVDSFFFLSGLLVAYLAVKQLRARQSMNWAYYVLHRYWRLTPMYAFVIFFYGYVYLYTLYGPWSFIKKVKSTPGQPSLTDGMDYCKKYWWTNLLYINNFYPNYGDLGKSCLGWGWYLANDMQFYLFIGPLMLIPVWLSFTYFQHGIKARVLRISAIAISVLLIFACIFIRMGLVLYYGIYDELTGAATKHKDDPYAQHGPLYGRPYARWSVYVIGLLTGYLLAMKNNRIRIHRLLALLGWCVAIASGLAVIYGQYYYNEHFSIDPTKPGPHMTKTQAVFYISLGRAVWGLCLAWIVVACVSGNGGPVSDILSWKIWAPLGRLTYAAYLVHPIVIFHYYLNLSKPFHIADLEMVYAFVANLVLSYGLAFLVSMVCEAPMIQLEKFVLESTMVTQFGSRFNEVWSNMRMRCQRKIVNGDL
ncbi:nose resistant to fluoxetine protein 6-like [Mya arenaria]|uniref:nose resistant to fluoxetine protein 6-like n=1 Tax=Mya arenaria TaxID=6604 RepID=UPI0022E62DC7|nr:nose resistant to fluoxetine protein 6-like [Mya arenaria]